MFSLTQTTKVDSSSRAYSLHDYSSSWRRIKFKHLSSTQVLSQIHLLLILSISKSTASIFSSQPSLICKRTLCTYPIVHSLIRIFFRAQIQAFVVSLGEQHNDINRFKLSLRDFLISLKEFSGDNTELFREEREAEAQQKALEERIAAMRIPGMLKPSQLDDKDEDI